MAWIRIIGPDGEVRPRCFEGTITLAESVNQDEYDELVAGRLVAILHRTRWPPSLLLDPSAHIEPLGEEREQKLELRPPREEDFAMFDFGQHEREHPQMDELRRGGAGEEGGT
jgi:hypothetical protein